MRDEQDSPDPTQSRLAEEDRQGAAGRAAGARARGEFAVLKNRPDMVRLLLKIGADPRARDSRGYTPLNFAKPESDPAIAELLIAAGAQPTERNVNRFEHLVPLLNVGSVAASIDYYVNKLGFRKLWDWGEPPTFAGVGRDQVELFLSQDDWGGPTSLSIFVQDVDGALRGLPEKRCRRSPAADQFRLGRARDGRRVSRRPSPALQRRWRRRV